MKVLFDTNIIIDALTDRTMAILVANKLQIFITFFENI